MSPVRPPAPIPGPVAVVPSETRAARPAAVLQPHQRIPRWLERTELFVRVLVKIWIGVFVCIFPWLTPIWDHNLIFTLHPALGTIAASGAARGLVSGLGLLNLWIAFRDAMGKGSDGDSK